MFHVKHAPACSQPVEPLKREFNDEGRHSLEDFRPAGHTHPIEGLLDFDIPVSRSNWRRLVIQMLFNAGKGAQERPESEIAVNTPQTIGQ